MDRYIEDVLRRGELYIEIERIRHLLIRIHKAPLPNRAEQREVVVHATKLFQALLRAKEARLRREG
jgi:hypothetical protein